MFAVLCLRCVYGEVPGGCVYDVFTEQSLCLRCVYENRASSSCVYVVFTKHITICCCVYDVFAVYVYDVFTGRSVHAVFTVRSRPLSSVKHLPSLCLRCVYAVGLLVFASCERRVYGVFAQS